MKIKILLRKNKMFRNASWIVGCKIIQSILAFMIGVFTARYLGPSNYGLINYASSLVAFATPIMQLGFNETLIQEFITKPKDSGTILGTSLMLNICSGIASVIGILVFSMVANVGDKETILVCFLYSLKLVFQAAEMTQYWFQSKLLSKYTSLTSLIAYVVVTVYKVYILIDGKSIYWFALTHAIEAFIISALLILIFKKFTNQKLSFSYELGKQMFNKSKHYISSGLMLVIFQQTDKIMLKFMMNETEVGFYSSAITCIAITGFIFSAIIDSARPWILEGKSISESIFINRLKVLLSIVICISLSQSIVMTIFAKAIISLLFGTAFLPAVSVLRISVWFITFGYMGTIRNIWILANDKQKYLPIINLSGAVLNIAINYILIPDLGAQGAAVASFFTQFFTNVILCFLLKPIREIAFVMLDALRPKTILIILKDKLV